MVRDSDAEGPQGVAPTAIVTDHAWPQSLDSVGGPEPITMMVFRPSYERAV